MAKAKACVVRVTAVRSAGGLTLKSTSQNHHVYTFTGTRWVNRVQYDHFRCVFCLALREVPRGK